MQIIEVNCQKFIQYGKNIELERSSAKQQMLLLVVCWNPSSNQKFFLRILVKIRRKKFWSPLGFELANQRSLKDQWIVSQELKKRSTENKFYVALFASIIYDIILPLDNLPNLCSIRP